MPDFADDSVDLTDIKEVQKPQRKSKSSIKLEKKPPLNLTWSNQPYFKAVADSEGVRICDLTIIT